VDEVAAAVVTVFVVKNPVISLVIVLNLILVVVRINKAVKIILK